MAVSTAQVNLDSYESLMRNSTASKMNGINSFLTQVRNGESVDYAAFQIKYDEMLDSFDAPWEGSIRILFFSFTKEWFKGELSGTRYIENDLYALLTSCKEYETANSDLESAQKTLEDEIRTAYESIVTARTLICSSRRRRRRRARIWNASPRSTSSAKPSTARSRRSRRNTRAFSSISSTRSRPTMSCSTISTPPHAAPSALSFRHVPLHGHRNRRRQLRDRRRDDAPTITSTPTFRILCSCSAWKSGNVRTGHHRI